MNINSVIEALEGLEDQAQGAQVYVEVETPAGRLTLPVVDALLREGDIILVGGD